MLDTVREFLQHAGRPRICVVGDVMLDIYVWGDVSRISQEGPIPVLHVRTREHRPGGAGVVAAMLSSLGCAVDLVGLVGQDAAAQTLREDLRAADIDVDGLVESPERPTTVKARYLGYVQSAGRALQQLLRVDDEETRPTSPDEAAELRRVALEHVERADAVVLQDLGKGLFNDALLRAVIERCADRGTPVIVDPEHSDQYRVYAGATCILPNRFEAEKATGLTLRGEDDYRAAARKLLEDLSLQCAVIKLDRDGIYFATADGDDTHITTEAREVADVTGAGDMVAAAIALALAEGADYGTAVALANFAGGIEVRHHGATSIPRADLVLAMQAEVDPTARKIVDGKDIEQLADDLRRAGSKLVFTNGCFDLLHLGHVELIRFARAQGDALIVGLNSDESARKLKGPGRPVNSEAVRSRVLASMADVDYVVLFDEESVLPLLRQVRPDVLVKGGDYTLEQVIGHDLVESYGGEVRLAPQVEGFSTTELIRRISGNDEGSNPGDAARDD
jgi:D-beta-D-heptose 7-phosphate kinase/D-beta-D-heptose 1-phosphate adenosyltransferase